MVGGEGQSVLNAWMSGEEQNWGWGGAAAERRQMDGLLSESRRHWVSAH